MERIHIKHTKVLGLLFVALLILFPGTAIAAEWYEGGNLHEATISEWKKATPENKLATCGDFIAALFQHEQLNLPITTVESIKPYAQELVSFIDLATEEDEDESFNEYIDSQTVQSFVISGVLMMGWTE